ncbi:helix-hairpin-helix domain-containing protein [Haloarchaeobius sp. DT45]|uniref:helix-hairpin-helix domain-containing protein n=1 Tax=Haloarchaeobius sp. DT45 TaxID=3446116 RepID=UPI003F6CD4A1
MALLKKLKSLLGLDDDSQPRSSRDVGVTVEKERREPSTAAETTSTEAAGVESETVEETVSEAEPATSETAGVEASVEASEAEEPVAEAETEAEEPAAESEPETESAGGVEEAEPESTGSEAEPEPTEAEAEPESTETEAEPEPAEPTDDIKGIGPAYAERLANAGIETVADLAKADPEAVAEETDISSTRIEQWVKRAKARR